MSKDNIGIAGLNAAILILSPPARSWINEPDMPKMEAVMQMILETMLQSLCHFNRISAKEAADMKRKIEPLNKLTAVNSTIWKNNPPKPQIPVFPETDMQ